jgi:hypothetical protein
MSWFSACFRQGFCNLGGPDLATFDARALARRWKEIGAELVYMDAIHQTETLYPTALSLHAPYLKGRDLVKEFTDACRELGLRAGAYITPFEHTPFTKDHPEWCQTRTDGGEHEGQTWWPHNYWGCWNSPMLDKMVALLEECYSRYPFEAAFYDGLLSRHGVCHCPACQAKFKADTGHALPNAHDGADPIFREYLAWKDHTLAEACRRVVQAVRVKNPDVQVVTNTPAAWCNWCAVQPVEFFDATEFACCEVFPGFMDLKRGGYIHASSVGTMAYSIAYTRGQSRGYPKVQCYNYVGYVNFNTDLDVLLEARSTVAMGGVLCAAGYRPALKAAFDSIKPMESYMTDVVPVGHVAIAASQESCNTQHDPNGYGLPFFEDLTGAFHLLLDNRVPVEFVSGRDLGEGLLDRYAVLVLSDLGYITAPQAEAIRQFVAAGGGLIATGQTSLIGVDGKPLPDFALADVLGVRAQEEPKDWQAVGGYMQEASKACLCFDDGEPWWGDAAQTIMGPESAASAKAIPWLASGQGYLLTSPFQPVKAARGARVRATVRAHADPRRPVLPGIVASGYGKGKVLYIAARLGETYARYPFLIWRRLMAEALKRVTPRPAPVEVEAPLCVTSYAWEQPADNRWVIHLLNDLDETGRPRGRMSAGKNDMYGSCPRTRTVPVENIVLTLRKRDATRAFLPLEGKELKVRKVRDGIKVRLRRLDQHALIVVA